MGRVVQVVVNTPSSRSQQEFSYLVPEELAFIGVGWRVAVPFGSRVVEGFIVADGSDSATTILPQRLREILAPIDAFPMFDHTMLALARWLAAYYLCPLYEALRCFIPGRAGLRWEKSFSPLKSAVSADITPRQQAVLDFIAARRDTTMRSLRQRFGTGVIRHLAVLTAAGLIEEKQRTILRPHDKSTKILLFNREMQEPARRLLNNPGRRQAQCRLLAALLQGPGYLRPEEVRKLHVSASSIRSLVAQGFVSIRMGEEAAGQAGQMAGSSIAPMLAANPAQRAAIANVNAALATRQFHAYLLHGVTGSGKTEVYLQCAKMARQMQRQVIVLVPEIALTSLLVERFTARFGDDVTVVHSRLSEGEKYAAWRRMCLGQAGIVIGARSALFAPLRHVGLLIIDEEHEFTYKQEESPRYHVRTVARQRALMTGAVLLAGSATPSLESYYQCEQRQMTLLRLPQRVMNRPMPPVQVVDLRREFVRGHRGVISAPLAQAITTALSRGQQAIVLLNRRGYATFVLCRECGHIIKCPHCDVTMTYHLAGQRLQCHYCGYTCRPPTLCPVCGSRYIRYFGTGTQKVEEELHHLFPHARIARLDQDTTGTKNAFHNILSDFRNGNTDILLGTQMVAKGHDFPQVTVVGVISADTALNLPDFRAAERTFALLVQAAGRAGRGDVPGQVIIQTYNPEHYAIQAMLHYDYLSFYRQEIQLRRSLSYPPFSRLIKITVHGKQEGNVRTMAKKLVAALKAAAYGQDWEIIGPFAAAVLRVREVYRYHILLKVSNDRCKEWLNAAGLAAHRDIIIDIDPINML